MIWDFIRKKAIDRIKMVVVKKRIIVFFICLFEVSDF